MKAFSIILLAAWIVMAWLFVQQYQEAAEVKKNVIEWGHNYDRLIASKDSTISEYKEAVANYKIIVAHYQQHDSINELIKNRLIQNLRLYNPLY